MMNHYSYRGLLRSNRDLMFALLFFLLATPGSLLLAQQKYPVQLASATSQSVKPTIKLRPTGSCASNLVTLKDVAEVAASGSMAASLNSTPLGPSPSLGRTVRWTKADVQQLLQIRGIDVQSMQWTGSESCNVSRVVETAPVEIRKDFTPSHQTPQATLTAERSVAVSLQSYLENHVGDTSGWIIKPTIPAEYTKLLMQRRVIVGIAGGEAPWTGGQSFTLLVKDGAKEISIPIEAKIEIPPMVWAAANPLAKGHVISEEDLKLVRVTSSNNVKVEDCCLQSKDLVGKELRKSMSTGQPIQRVDAGPPRVIAAQEKIEIQVVAGSIVAQTVGQALQAGSIDDVIQVELVNSRKRLAARVIGPGLVEAIASNK